MFASIIQDRLRYVSVLISVGSMLTLYPGMSQAAAPSPSTATDLSTAVMDVARRAVPTVVHIEVTERQEVANPIAPLEEEPFFRRFFNTPDLPKKFKRDVTALGSGILIDAQGHILTNHHVASGASKIDVWLDDGRKFPAHIVGSDPKTDLAVLKIDAKTPLPYVTFGDSDTVEVGAWVIAIGHPRGLDQSVTHGIISAKHRRGITDPTSYQDFLQTDAAINPGNSGGPLLNLHGDVIGVNTAIASENGGFEGIGFAIPSNMALYTAKALIAHGKVERAWMGVNAQNMTPELAQTMHLKGSKGALIADIVKGSPADHANLKRGDVVIAYQHRDITDADDLRNAVASTPIGQHVDVTIWRRGKKQNIPVTVRSQEESTRALLATVAKRLGATVRDVTAHEAEQYGLESQQGVTLTQVKPDGVLGRAGLEVRDILLAIADQPIEGVEQLADMVAAMAPHQRVALLALDHRSGDTGYVELTIP